VAGGGSLRTYLGIAPGVGKTVAMLAEGRRRAENGERVVVGWIEAQGRSQASRQLSGLEVIAPRSVAYRGTVFADFDAPAAIASGWDRHRELTADLGGTYTQIDGHAPAEALAEAAQGAGTVVVGRHRSRLAELAHGSVSSRLRRLLPRRGSRRGTKTVTGAGYPCRSTGHPLWHEARSAARLPGRGARGGKDVCDAR
jgi:K+-sensing histidine kinase KdpD